VGQLQSSVQYTPTPCADFICLCPCLQEIVQSPPSAAAAGHMRAQASSTNMALKCDWTSLSPDVLAKVFKACELGRDRKKFSHAERMRTGPYWCYTPSPRSNFRIICKAWCEAAGWLLLHCLVIAAVTLHHHFGVAKSGLEQPITVL